MNKGVSVIICTYNGKSKLDATLSHLINQKLNVPCEIVLVDNASTDGTKSFIEDWWATNNTSNITLRVFSQPIPGKSYAQDLGYAKANFEYLLVCDDDNWLCSSYIQTAYDIMEQDMQIGALGGWCEAVFESPKPNWFDVHAKYFAVSKQGTKSGDITNKKGCLYGAGMMLRKSHWLELKRIGFEHLLSCRKGDSLSSGGDTEYCFALRLLGYEIWYDDRLYFKHFMTSGRLNLAYLSRLRKAMTYSNFVLWTYLDLLNGRTRTYKDFITQFIKGMPFVIIKKTGALLIGNYEQKQGAKHYFRLLYYLIFYYTLYQKNITFINSWHAKASQI